MVERILLTGAGGFVGHYLRPALAARWPDATLIGLGLKRPGVTEAHAASRRDADLLPVDLLDAEAIAAVVLAQKPDLVVHLAAQSSVALSTGVEARDATWAVNLSGTLNLALAVAAHAPEATFVFASTAEVYGASFLGGPVDEASPPVPMNTYAKSKWLAEQALAAVLPPQAKLIVARPFNHTGPGQKDVFVLPSFAAQVARMEAGLQPATLAVGNLDVRRDFLDVRDVVSAYVALIEAAPRLPSRFVCNIASGTSHRLADLLEGLRDLARVPFAIAVDPARLRPVDLPIAAAKPQLLQAATGWRPTIGIEATLEALLDAARRAL